MDEPVIFSIRISKEKLEEHAKKDFYNFLTLVEDYKDKDIEYYNKVIQPLIIKYKPENIDIQVAEIFNKYKEVQNENLTTSNNQRRRNIIILCILIIFSFFLFVLLLINSKINSLEHDNKLLVEKIEQNKKLQEEEKKKEQDRIEKIERDKMEKERRERENIESDSYLALYKLLNSVPLLYAVTVGDRSTIERALKYDYTLYKIPVVGGGYSCKWTYNIAPQKTYFEVKRLYDRVYKIYFRIGTSYQDGIYNIDLNNNAISVDYDNFSRTAGF